MCSEVKVGNAYLGYTVVTWKLFQYVLTLVSGITAHKGKSSDQKENDSEGVILCLLKNVLK
jgi:hypothetical protein